MMGRRKTCVNHVRKILEAQIIVKTIKTGQKQVITSLSYYLFKLSKDKFKKRISYLQGKGRMDLDVLRLFVILSKRNNL